MQNARAGNSANAVEESEQQLWDFIRDHFSQQRVRYRLVSKSIFEPVPRKGPRLPEPEGYVLADFDFTTEEILKLRKHPDVAWRMGWFQAIKNREAKDAPIVEEEHPLLQAVKEFKGAVKGPKKS